MYRVRTVCLAARRTGGRPALGTVVLLRVTRQQET